MTAASPHFIDSALDSAIDAALDSALDSPLAIDLLCLGHPLPAKYKDHPLIGDLHGSRDCHIEPDWILIYTWTEKRTHLRLERTGTHADLFD